MSEVGFYHSSWGYWQASNEPDEEMLASYPEGTIRVPLKPGANYELEDGDWVQGPAEPEPEVVTVLYPVDLWSRLTDEEADQVDAAMATQSVRVLNIFRTASSFRSDHDLWTLLESTAIALFGAPRAAEILAPSAGT